MRFDHLSRCDVETMENDDAGCCSAESRVALELDHAIRNNDAMHLIIAS